MQRQYQLTLNWKCDERMVEVSRGHEVFYVRSGSNVICQVWRPQGGTCVDALDVAKAISALPELLVACHEVLPCVETGAASKARRLELVEQLERALKKAGVLK